MSTEAEKPEEYTILVEIKTKNSFLIIHIENPCLKIEESIKMTSDYKLVHGYGLLNVKAIVAKCAVCIIRKIATGFIKQLFLSL